jgi:hypothetical protein
MEPHGRPSADRLGESGCPCCQCHRSSGQDRRAGQVKVEVQGPFRVEKTIEEPLQEAIEVKVQRPVEVEEPLKGRRSPQVKGPKVGEEVSEEVLQEAKVIRPQAFDLAHRFQD